MQIDLEPEDWQSERHQMPWWHSALMICFYVGVGIPLTWLVSGAVRWLVELVWPW